MERIDISDGRRIADLVDAVERGEEVVIVRGGVQVAAVVAAEVASPPAGPKRFDMAALEKLRADFPLRIADPAGLIRALRDADDH